MIPGLVWGQINLNIPTLSLKEQGLTALKNRDYFSASDYLSAYVLKKPNDMEASWSLAEAYRKSNHYQAAKPLYAKVYLADANKYKLAMYYHALMLKHLEEYEAAMDHFNRFLRDYPDTHSLDYKRAVIEREGCALGMSLESSNQRDQAKVLPLNSSINKPYIELSPFYIDSTHMIYGSFAIDSIKYYLQTEQQKIPKRRLYGAEKKDSTWFGGVALENTLNDPKMDVGNGAYNVDKTRFYFTKCEESMGEYRCKIYLSKKVNGTWSEAVVLPKQVNDDEYTQTQPCVQSTVANSDVLYYVSDRNDGLGGKDIWLVEYDFETNKAKEPVNAGIHVNTPWDEQTPFFHAQNKTLYFSTNGRVSLGGTDIYKSTLSSAGKHESSQHLGLPYNSSFDDLYFVLAENEKEGFLVSNRTGSKALKNEHCCDDIFYFKPVKLLTLKYEGTLYNASYVERVLEMEDDDKKNELIEDVSKYIIPNQKIVMYDYSSSKNPIPIDSTISNERGEFAFNIQKNKKYKFIIERDGFFNKHHVFNTNNISSGVIRQNIGLVEITLEPIIIKNIYYPFDEWYLTQEAKTIIDTTVYEILVENPKLIIELSSHTDYMGSDDYNEILSQQRAESVVKYLISKNISSNRLRAQGYGENKPIAPNVNPDGSDNPEGRQKNRRTEFRVIGALINGKEIIYEE